MTLKEFHKHLRQISRHDDDRPFVCCGSPLDCEVFIVGVNPATPGVEFWRYFDDKDGFSKPAFLQAYAEHRMRAGKPAHSRTRNNIERLVCAAAPARCLETNIWAACAAKPGDVPQSRRNTECFEFLLSEIKPKLIVCHGKVKVWPRIERLLDLDEGALRDSELLNAQGVRILPVKHLRLLSGDQLKALGRCVAKLAREQK